MNKPIRRVAFVAMLMFGLLLANGTYMMIWCGRARWPRSRRTAASAMPSSLRTVARSWPPARPRSRLPSRPTTRFKFQRVYPEGELYAPVTGFYSYDHARTALESSYNSQLAGTDDALFVSRLIDLATNRTPQGASVQTTIVPKVQRAAAKLSGPEGGGGRARSEHRGGAGHGHESELRPERDRQPRHRCRQQGVRPTCGGPDQSAVEPCGQGDLPAGFHLQAGHHSGRAGRRQDAGQQGGVARSG